MSISLPPLKWLASPNFSARVGGTKPDLIVIHDCEGGYQGSIATFRQTAPRQVSAHIVLREDGGEATQMVGFGLKAWHAVAFNSRSIGIEMAGFEAKGFAVTEWQEAAAIAAYLCRRYSIPMAWSQGGRSPGICRHLDLGAAGGGHVDPTQDAATWTHFLDLVEEASRTMAWPAESWGFDVSPGHDAPSRPVPTSSSLPQPASAAQAPLAVGDIGGLRRALGNLGFVDEGSAVASLVMAFQTAKGTLKVDGIAGPRTVAAINAAVSQQGAAK